jgi:tetratricopeptide (TPR) repeat protein
VFIEADHVENLRILLRAIPEGQFSFVVVQCNHASCITEIEQAILQQSPDRPIRKIAYPLPTNTSVGYQAKELGEGVLMVTDFQEIMKDRTSWRLFNQSRDQISAFPIALIVFVPTNPKVTRFMIDNMRDFWSIRNLVVEFWKEHHVAPVLLMDPFLEHSDFANWRIDKKDEQRATFLAAIPDGDTKRTSNDELENPKALQSYLYFAFQTLDYQGMDDFCRRFPQLTSKMDQVMIAWAKFQVGKTIEALDILNAFFEHLDAFKSYWDSQIVFETLSRIVAINILTANESAASESLDHMLSYEFFPPDSIFEQHGWRWDHAKEDRIRNQSESILQGYFNLVFKSPEMAITAFQKALTYLPEDGDQLARNMVVSNLAEAYLVSGDYYMAYETANEAYQAIHTIGDAYLESIVLFQLGRIKAAQGLPEKAIPHLDLAIKISRYLGAPSLAMMEQFRQAL